MSTIRDALAVPFLLIGIVLVYFAFVVASGPKVAKATGKMINDGMRAELTRAKAERAAR